MAQRRAGASAHGIQHRYALLILLLVSAGACAAASDTGATGEPAGGAPDSLGAPQGQRDGSPSWSPDG
ncbi:MAG: hypothetical protein PVJ51_14040, partial [Acidobacteriota bacterium]